jgi:predicted nucleic acid-binding protein
MTPDVNMLVAAFRADHVHHERAHGWLASVREACVRGRESLTVLPMIAVGFLRVVTSARVFKQPDSVEDALAFIDALLDGLAHAWNREQVERLLYGLPIVGRYENRAAALARDEDRLM